MRSRGWSTSAAIWALALTAGPMAPTLRAQSAEAGDLAWPPPPEVARIRYTGALASERDLGKRSSFFGKIKRFLTGGGPQKVFRLERPFDVYTREGERIYFTDGVTPGVMLFDRSAKAARLLGGDVPGGLSRPMGLGGDGTGRVYVTDPGTARVVVFSPDGRYERAFGGARALLNPVDVAVDAAADRYYVVDSYAHEVVVFDSAGRETARLGKLDARPGDAPPAAVMAAAHTAAATAGPPRDLVANRGGEPGAFRYPVSAAVGPDGTLYVSDQMNFRVQVFDREGRFVRAIGRMGDTPGSFARPKGVALDSEGHVYVADAAFNNVQVFDAEGRLLLAFGSLGTGPGNHWMPLGVCVDAQNRIYVADRYNNRAQIYQYLPAAGGADEH